MGDLIGGLVIGLAILIALLVVIGQVSAIQRREPPRSPQAGRGGRSTSATGGRSRVTNRKLDPAAFEEGNLAWAREKGRARVTYQGMNPDHEIRPVAPHERGGVMRNAVVVNRKTGRAVRYETVDWKNMDTPPS